MRKQRARVSRVLPTVVLGALLCAGRARADEPLRLEQAVRTALENNERARKAPLRVEQAEGSLDRARGAFYPTLTAGGAAQHAFQVAKNGKPNTTSGTITLNQPLVAPSAFPLYSQASHSLESEKWGSIQDKRVLAFDTAKAFVQALNAEAVLEAAVQRLARAKANLDDAQARADAGLASTNDVTRAAIEVTSSATQVAQAKGRVEAAYLDLGFLMNKPIAPPQQGAPSPLALPNRTTNAANSFESNPDDQVRVALERRPDLHSAHEKTESLRASAREPYYRLAPTLSAQGQSRLNPDPLPSEPSHEETVTLNLTWTLFDAGFRYADRRTRDAQAESQALDEALLRRSIDNDIRTALVTLQAAREEFKIANDAVALAQKSSEETGILYKQGLARAIELTDATAQRFDAEVTRATAKLLMEQAYLDLRFAIGLGPTDDDLEGAKK